ncbi:poly(A)-specific ribonuclease, partial [Lecanoromycetidae sp. Uapishka_2]
MEVNGIGFQSQLPSILGAIAQSRFVAFDLELSGIPGRQTGQARAPGRSQDGKQTLQERYEDTRKAAERYQIIQLGLTCVEENLERGVYVARPYNFFLNPVPGGRLDVERDFTYQSGAVEFLLSVGFRMDAPFTQGVPYLSRDEEARARSNSIAKQDKNRYKDIFIPEDDLESLQFIRRVRQEISEWTMRTTSEPAFLNIAPPNHDSPDYNGRGLNGYQKRLVHQLVRAEFPDLVSISKLDFVQLLPFDQQREDFQLQKKLAWFEKSLTSQIGLRWIAEAICPNVDHVLEPQRAPPNASGNLEALTPWVYPLVPMPEAESEAIASRFHELLEILRTRRTVLVGHNVFLDLIYFFSCFFGPLPDRVEDFQKLIAQLFPMVFDTKYLADKINNNSPLYKSSLEEIDKELSKLPVPVIETPPDHDKYMTDSPMHEAGFDSFLTAKILIRLSARTEGEAQADLSPVSDDEAYQTASEDGGVSLNGQDDSTTYGHTNGTTSEPSTISHNNPYNLLSKLSLEHGLQPEKTIIDKKSPKHTMMPDEDSSFWTLYGNKLRVNGTVEEVCVIR